MQRIDGQHPTYGAAMQIRLRRQGRLIAVDSFSRYYRDMTPEEAAQKLDDAFEELFKCGVLPTVLEPEYRTSGEPARFQIGDEIEIDGATVVKDSDGWRLKQRPFTVVTVTT